MSNHIKLEIYVSQIHGFLQICVVYYITKVGIYFDLTSFLDSDTSNSRHLQSTYYLSTTVVSILSSKQHYEIGELFISPFYR